MAGSFPGDYWMGVVVLIEWYGVVQWFGKSRKPIPTFATPPSASPRTLLGIATAIQWG